MRSSLLALLGLLAISTPCCSQQSHGQAAANNEIKSVAARGLLSKQLVLEVLQSDSGVGGTNQFVYLRLFADRSVEFSPKRNQELKRDRVFRAQISGEDMDSTAKVLGREDVANLPGIFRSTFTPIDFYWTLDFSIPRGTHNQKITVVNFSPGMAKQNHKPYPEALVRLVCTVWAVRKNFPSEMPDLREDCRDFVVEK
jgi:hypothetical protein